MAVVDVNGTAIDFGDLSGDDLNKAVKAAADQMSPKPKTMAEKAVGLLAHVVPGVPTPEDNTIGGRMKSLWGSVKESYLAGPNIKESLKRMFSPRMGQFGLSRFMQEQGQLGKQAIDTMAENSPYKGTIPFKAGRFVANALPATPSDLQDMIAAEQASRVVGAGINKALRVATKGSEIATNVPSRDFEKVMDNPLKVASAPSVKAARTPYLAEAEKAGFLPSTEVKASGLDKYIGAKNPFDQGVAKDYFDKLSKGEKLTPDDLFHFYQNIGEKIRPANIKLPKGAKNIDLRTELKNALAEISPEWAKTADVYGNAMTKARTTSLYPQTDTGRPSFARMFGGSVLSQVAHSPQSLLTGAAAVSPLVHTIAYATAGAGMKTLEKVLQTPGAGVLVFSAIQNMLRNKNVEEQAPKTEEQSPNSKSEGIDEAELTDFIMNAKEGTRFKFKGSDKEYKVVPRKERTEFKNDQDKKDYEKSRRLLGAFRTKTFTLA